MNESMITTASQIKIPWVVKAKSIDEPIIASLMILNRRALIGKDRPIARIHVIRPITRPSITTDFIISKSTAPIARMTPISRVRSMTFIPIVPVKPMLPTKAVSRAMISKKMTRMLIACEVSSRVTRPASTLLTIKPRSTRYLFRYSLISLCFSKVCSSVVTLKENACLGRSSKSATKSKSA